MPEKIEKFGGKLVSRSEAVSTLETIRFDHKDGYVEVRVTPNAKKGGDFIINHIMTQPESDDGKGYGSAAVIKIRKYAKSKGASRILASITEDSKEFWKKCGFKESRDNPKYYERKP